MLIRIFQQGLAIFCLLIALETFRWAGICYDSGNAKAATGLALITGLALGCGIFIEYLFCGI